jgi:hypothetical protein
LNPIEPVCQRCTVTAVQLDVITRRVLTSSPHRVSDHERDCFGFELARVTRSGAVVAVVKKFVGLCSEGHKPTYVLRLVMCWVCPGEIALSRAKRRGGGEPDAGVSGLGAAGRGATASTDRRQRVVDTARAT